MTDTVFILGAGVSFYSGIPLLSGFVERMSQFAIRQTNRASPLFSENMPTISSDEDLAFYQPQIQLIANC